MMRSHVQHSSPITAVDMARVNDHRWTWSEARLLVQEVYPSDAEVEGLKVVFAQTQFRLCEPESMPSLVTGAKASTAAAGRKPCRLLSPPESLSLSTASAPIDMPFDLDPVEGALSRRYVGEGEQGQGHRGDKLSDIGTGTDRRHRSARRLHRNRNAEFAGRADGGGQRAAQRGRRG